MDGVLGIAESIGDRSFSSESESGSGRDLFFVCVVARDSDDVDVDDVFFVGGFILTTLVPSSCPLKALGVNSG